MSCPHPSQTGSPSRCHWSRAHGALHAALGDIEPLGLKSLRSRARPQHHYRFHKHTATPLQIQRNIRRHKCDPYQWDNSWQRLLKPRPQKERHQFRYPRNPMSYDYHSAQPTTRHDDVSRRKFGHAELAKRRCVAIRESALKQEVASCHPNRQEPSRDSYDHCPVRMGYQADNQHFANSVQKQRWRKE